MWDGGCLNYVESLPDADHVAAVDDIKVATLTLTLKKVDTTTHSSLRRSEYGTTTVTRTFIDSFGIGRMAV